jgi:hypothetical protein
MTEVAIITAAGEISPLERAAEIARSHVDAPLNRALDIIGSGPRDINVPLTVAEIRAALSEGRFFIERLPLTSHGLRITVTPETAVHFAVLWALANALVNNAKVEVVNE